MSEIQEAPLLEQTALAVIPASQLPTLLAADTDDILGRLAAEINGFHGDVTTEKGRKEIASKAYKVATAKQDLIRLAGTLKEGAQRTIKSVNAEVAVVEERMNALRDQVRAPLDEFQEREKSRIAEHEAAIAEIVGWSAIDHAWTSAQIGERIVELNAHPHRDRDWQEFREKAQAAARASFNALKVAQMEMAEREKAAAEAARIAEEEAEHQRQETARLQAEREARIAAEAAEAARVAAERRAAEEAAQEAARAAAERARIEAEAEAAAEAAEAERQRVMRQAAEATLAVERRAEAERKAAARREQEAKAALERKEQERIAAEARFMAAVEQAERDRVAAQDSAEREKQAAIEAERAKLKAQEAAEAAEMQRRAANKAHRQKINQEALASLVTIIGEIESEFAAEEIGKRIIIGVAQERVVHVQINY